MSTSNPAVQERMSTPVRTVRAYMTTVPHSVGLDQTLAQAHAVMKAHSIRHLPVLQSGSLVGLLTLRDLQILETLDEGETSDLRIGHAMRKRVYAVAPETPLEEVVVTMANRKLDCAVVVHNHHVVGIFTHIDLSRACVDLLRAAAAAEPMAPPPHEQGVRAGSSSTPG